MIYNFVTITSKFEEVVVATAKLKRENSVIIRLSNEADKLFGKGNWKQVPDYSNSLDNVIGWYACQIETSETLEVRPVF